MNWQIEQGTAILFGMACALVTLVLVIAFLTDALIRSNHERDVEAETTQDEHVAYIIHQIEHVIVAARLRELARNYESPDNILLRKTLGRKAWKEDGPPLPALWLDAIAEKISPRFPCGFGETAVEHEHNMAGECLI